MPTHFTALLGKQTTSGQNAWALPWQSGKLLCTPPEMPPRPRKKLGYNWKARQSNKSRPNARDFANGRQDVNSSVLDTNTLLLPCRRNPSLVEIEDKTPKRKRLSSKQKKRLLKVLEVKEKKNKVGSN